MVNLASTAHFTGEASAFDQAAPAFVTTVFAGNLLSAWQRAVVSAIGLCPLPCCSLKIPARSYPTLPLSLRRAVRSCGLSGLGSCNGDLADLRARRLPPPGGNSCGAEADLAHEEFICRDKRE